jgi:hypothetical protein
MKSELIKDEDREYFGTDSKRFFERALLNAVTWEEGVKYAKELRNLQHPSLSAVQNKNENVNAIELRWSRPSELRSNELETVTIVCKEQGIAAPKESSLEYINDRKD